MVMKGKLWCFFVVDRCGIQKINTKTYTVADIPGETGEKGKQHQNFPDRTLTSYGIWELFWEMDGLWLWGLPGGAG